MIERRYVMNRHGKFSGMPGFTIVWLGQMVSILGSSMTTFAVMIWIWKEGAQVTPFAIFGFIATMAQIIASPFAGALVDRWNRKLTMAISDIMAGISSIIVLILYITSSLQIWHLYLLAGFTSFFGAFQFPAFSAATTTMVSKEDYVRASGMRSIVENLNSILYPILAVFLLGIIGLKGILIIDIFTFVFAVGVLFFVHIPPPKVSKEGEESKGSLWKESAYGFKYLYQRKSLLGLLLVFLSVNIALAFSNILRTPMILARTGNNEWILSVVQSVSMIGGFLGGLILLVWGGPKDRIRGIFVSLILMSIGVSLMGTGSGFVVWSVAGFLSAFFAVVAGACTQAFWQAKVAPDVQGKVFAARSIISTLASPIAMLICGPLADFVFEPAMVNGGSLTKIFGWIVGTEPGSGMALLFLLIGAFAVITSILGYMANAMRKADKILADYEAI